jgi:hypothetical protein
MGLRSVQAEAATTSIAKMNAFAIAEASFLHVKADRTHLGISLMPASQDSGLSAYCKRKRRLKRAVLADAPCPAEHTHPVNLQVSYRR